MCNLFVEDRNQVATEGQKIALCLQIQTQIYQSTCWQLVPSHGEVVTSLRQKAERDICLLLNIIVSNTPSWSWGILHTTITAGFRGDSRLKLCLWWYMVHCQVYFLMLGSAKQSDILFWLDPSTRGHQFNSHHCFFPFFPATLQPNV
jgi:hypothetical protein